jgi:hypothetical protein
MGLSDPSPNMILFDESKSTLIIREAGTVYSSHKYLPEKIIVKCLVSCEMAMGEVF